MQPFHLVTIKEPSFHQAPGRQNTTSGGFTRRRGAPKHCINKGQSVTLTLADIQDFTHTKMLLMHELDKITKGIASGKSVDDRHLRNDEFCLLQDL